MYTKFDHGKQKLQKQNNFKRLNIVVLDLGKRMAVS